MSSFSKARSLALIISVGCFAAPGLARQPAMDAEGRIFGDTVNDPLPEWKQPAPVRVQAPLPPVPTAYESASMSRPGADRAAWEEARADWLAECRQRFGGSGRTTGGVVGGLVGGIAGSAIAGRGNRTVGAVIGGVTGAVAGAALGNAADRRRSRDYCESYLDRYMASYSQGYANNGYGYGYAQGQPVYGYAMQPMMMMVPVMMTTVAVPVAQQQVYTEVIEEWVSVTRPARRYIPRRAVPDKRVRVYPDKRIRVY